MSELTQRARAYLDNAEELIAGSAEPGPELRGALDSLARTCEALIDALEQTPTHFERRDS